ncbi:MAG: hypothetical protein IPN29_10370 [Saprospiraceae bacterium]|nr:hypothetical protein [Saprospiraceae bacterium]
MKIGFLTCSKLPSLSPSDQELMACFVRNGYAAKALIWDDSSVDWRAFDALIFRNTWDYFEKESAFMAFLDHLDTLGVTCFNPTHLVRQNIHKFYLKEFERNGIKVVPGIYLNQTSSFNLGDILPDAWQYFVVKPAFSAGAYQTSLFHRSEIQAANDQYRPIAAEKELIIQVFLPEIQSEGEWSFIFIGGVFSHCVRKVPAVNDFRVQSHLGGQYLAETPMPSQLQQAQKVMTLLSETCLYARVDGVFIEGTFFLMELELIEPDLYFEFNTSAYQAFVDAFSKSI